MRKKNNKIRKKVTCAALLSVIVLQINFLVNYKLVRIDGNSMLPTLADNQLVLIAKRNDEININDIIVFKTQDGFSVKRIFANENSIIKLSNGSVYIDDIELSPYTYEGVQEIIYEIKKDEYFVLGENHLISYDSRDYGPIKREDIIGKIIFHF